jgi:hypothetical protein
MVGADRRLSPDSVQPSSGNGLCRAREQGWNLYRQDFHLVPRHDSRVVGHVHIQAAQLNGVLKIPLL